MAGWQSVVGADASHGLQKCVGDITANPVLALSRLPTYPSLNTHAKNGVAALNIVLQGCNLQIKSTESENDTSGLGNLIVGWDDPSGTVQRRRLQHRPRGRRRPTRAARIAADLPPRSQPCHTGRRLIAWRRCVCGS
jgi:hypothetical protein